MVSSMYRHFPLTGVGLLLMTSVLNASPSAPVICRGMCDASAVAIVNEQQFIVADDEENILRAYSITNGGAALAKFDLGGFLQVTAKSPEADLEGSARLGEEVFWITSHARNKDGKKRPNRQRFFATRVGMAKGVATLEPVGHPYTRLLEDLLAAPALKRFDLAAAAERAPKTRDALNIEALCDTPEGTLLIGFRNPVPGGKALLVPLLNPREIVTDAQARARFGEPLLLDLQGLGLRSLARTGNRYLMIAGSYDGEGASKLFEWQGSTNQPRLLAHPELKGLNPEAIEILPGDGPARLLVVSDDGNLRIGGAPCKEVADPEMKYFRVTTLQP